MLRQVGDRASWMLQTQAGTQGLYYPDRLSTFLKNSDKQIQSLSCQKNALHRILLRPSLRNAHRKSLLGNSTRKLRNEIQTR